MNLEVMKKQAQVNTQLIKGAREIQTVILAKDGKQYNKRIIDAINTVLEPLDMVAWKKEGYGKTDYLEIMNRDRAVDGGKSWYYVSDYTLTLPIYYQEETKKIDATKIIENIISVIDTKEKQVALLLSNIENYDTLLKEKRELQELINKHNSKVSYYMEDLKVNYR